MFKKSKNGYYFWEEFQNIDGIIHGFSTRKFGDMNWKKGNSIKNLELFFKELGINEGKTVKMIQVHGNNVLWVSSKDRNGAIDNTDGILASDKGIFTVVTFADCVPVLFLDKNNKNIGIAHAGWKGVYKEIVRNMVDKMIKKGSNRSDIIVGIGPSVKVCCYDVNKDRADSFGNKFPKMKGASKIKDGKIYIDLTKIVKLQLKDCGILDRNILDSKICTKDNVSEFYSFRKEGGTESFGLCAGVIGRI